MDEHPPAPPTTPPTTPSARQDSPGPDRLERSPRREGVAADAAVVLGTFASLGVLCGVLWWLVVDPAEFTKFPNGGAMGEVDLGRQFAADGWYVVIAAVAGVLSGGALTWWRSRDPLLTCGLLLVGAGVAAGLMSLTGHLLGPGDPQQVLATIKVGAKVPARLEVSAFTVYLAWPIAVLGSALLVLWGRLPDPER